MKTERTLYRTALMSMGMLCGIFLTAIFTLVIFHAGKESGHPLFPGIVHAVGDDRVDHYIACTANVDTMEGFFLLDSLTGKLDGGVLSKRRPQFQARYQTNVHQDLKTAIDNYNKTTGKGRASSSSHSGSSAVVATGALQMPEEPKYMMVSAMRDTVGDSGNVRPANSAIFVTEVNTGLTLVYVVPWNRAAHSGDVNQPLQKLKLWTVDRFITPVLRPRD